MIEIQNSVTKAHEAMLKILVEGINKLDDFKHSDKEFEEAKT